MSERGTISRRGFLKGSGWTLAAGPFVLDAAVRAGPAGVPPSDRITVACIGVHNMGNNHLKTLLGRRDAQVVAICDVDRKIRAERIAAARAAYAARAKSGTFDGVAGCIDYRDVIARDDVDAVVIAVPDHNHAVITVDAIRQGKDVYIEKPMARYIRESRIMTETARRHGCVLQVGMQRRSSDTVRFACELVRNGRIGELENITIRITNRSGSDEPWQPQPVPPELDYERWLGPAPRVPYHPDRVHYTFRFVSDYSGGDVTNMGAHFVDVAQWGHGTSLTGPVEVRGSGRRNSGGIHDVFYEPDVTFRYADGVTMRLLPTDQWGDYTRFEGSEGWIQVGRRLVAEPASILRSQIGSNETRLYRAEGGHMGNFLQCMRTRGRTAAPAEVGHRSVTICHLANLAMQLGRPLRWDPQREQFAGDDEANRLMTCAYRSPRHL